MSLKQQVQPFLDEHLRYNGRGNIIPANLALIKMIQLVVDAVDNLDQRLSAIEHATIKPNGQAHPAEHIEPKIIPVQDLSGNPVVKRRPGRPRRNV